MQFIQIRNWKKFQHYKNRYPTWVKFYPAVLDDVEFECLPDASKLLLGFLPLLAARTHNKIPFNPAWIKKKLSLEAEVDLEPLFSIKFIELIDASNPLADCYQDARERREEKRREEKKEDAQKREDLIQEAKRIARGMRDV